MTVIQSIAAAADLPGVLTYLAIMATLLITVAWATYRDCQKERKRQRTLAARAAASAKTGGAVEQRRKAA